MPKHRKQNIDFLADFRDGRREYFKCTRDRLNEYWVCDAVSSDGNDKSNRKRSQSKSREAPRRMMLRDFEF